MVAGFKLLFVRYIRIKNTTDIGAIQVYKCNAVGGGRVSAFPEKSVTKVYSSMLLALRGSGWGSIFQEKSVT